MFQKMFDYSYYLCWEFLYFISINLPLSRRSANLTDFFALALLFLFIFIISLFLIESFNLNEINRNRLFAIEVLIDIYLCYYIYRKEYYIEIVERYSGKKYPKDA